MNAATGILLGALLALPACAQRPAAPATGGFDYYMLVLSYAPDFCDQPESRKDPRECGAGRGVGFVVHGLWPQNENSRGPARCGPARPVARASVDAMLSYFPTPGLVQHEWRDHGTCSGLTAADYFAAVRKARDSLRIPEDLNHPVQQVQSSPDRIEAELASANAGYPAGAFRTSCYRDGQLKEIRICLNRDLSPRPCSRSAGECRAPAVMLLPVR